jgi:hypothetical protein
MLLEAKTAALCPSNYGTRFAAKGGSAFYPRGGGPFGDIFFATPSSFANALGVKFPLPGSFANALGARPPPPAPSSFANALGVKTPLPSSFATALGVKTISCM